MILYCKKLNPGIVRTETRWAYFTGPEADQGIKQQNKLWQ